MLFTRRGYKYVAPTELQNLPNLSGDFFHRFNQPLDFFITRVARAARAHQAFRGESQTLNHRLRIEVAVRSEQTAISQTSRDFCRRNVLHGE